MFSLFLPYFYIGLTVQLFLKTNNKTMKKCNNMKNNNNFEIMCDLICQCVHFFYLSYNVFPLFFLNFFFFYYFILQKIKSTASRACLSKKYLVSIVLAGSCFDLYHSYTYTCRLSIIIFFLVNFVNKFKSILNLCK